MKVLVVEDDLGSRLVAESAVKSLGHPCRSAEDGEQAWQLFRQFSPDVVVSDITMPGLDGFELCARIRAHDNGRYTYLILLTSLSDPADVRAGMQAGADDYITKPMNPFDLEVRLLAASRVTTLHAHLAATRADLVRQANTDALTGLSNRAAFDAALPRMLERRRPAGRSPAVMILDLDGFKAVNDRHGHQVGDRLLRLTGQRLTALVRDGDLVARLGGDEFAVVFDYTDKRGALVLAERITAALSEPADLDGVSITTAASLGVYVPDGAADAEDALFRADVAMYSAKTIGGGYQVFDPEHHPSFAER